MWQNDAAVLTRPSTRYNQRLLLFREKADSCAPPAVGPECSLLEFKAYIEALQPSWKAAMRSYAHSAHLALVVDATAIRMFS
jgi:hypothetical protein